MFSTCKQTKYLFLYSVQEDLFKKSIIDCITNLMIHDQQLHT